MSSAGSSRPVPRPLQLPSNASSPRSSPVIGKSPLSASVRYNSDYERNGTPVTSPRMGPKRQGSIPYTSSPSTSSPSNHVRRNTVDIVTTGSPTTHQRSSLRPRSLLQPVNETEPATLAEKHADLLRFIAQKESKCMELRAQLAQHEAELLVLKQKWERIVSKGSPILPRASVELKPATSTRSDVLGGIREGVQNGFEKVLAVLEPAIVGSSSSSDSSSSESAESPVSTTTSTPLPSKPPSMSKHSKNTDSISFSQGRSSMSSSVSSLFDETLSNGTRSLDSPIGEDERPAHKSGTPSSMNSPSNANDRIALTNKSATAPPSTLSQLSSSFTSPDSIVPLGKSVAQWVSPTLNKKWEELKKNETISRQSKRASSLFNDMISSLSTSTSSTPASTSPPVRTSNPRSPISPLALDSIVGAPTGTGPPLSSLLDDNSENQLGMVLQPDNVIVPTTRTVPNTATNGLQRDDDDDDDDDDKWNW
ncbi:hypothetical protein Clacol_004579 [Clathrus columnatus]|uniref:DUF4048 domain-containing protein n=1 Tax=Clathrus columnatus TaxID=1419009 RepID=A0AAV5AA50_9AGAM|nr:hypothetical protein Clacol_004579 [Clathrus columnatus]